MGGLKTGFMNIAYLIAICVGAHSTANTMLAMRKLSQLCVLTKIDGGVRFAIGPLFIPPQCFVEDVGQ
jgi:hypothetical protein